MQRGAKRGARKPTRIPYNTSASTAVVARSRNTFVRGGKVDPKRDNCEPEHKRQKLEMVDDNGDLILSEEEKMELLKEAEEEILEAKLDRMQSEVEINNLQGLLSEQEAIVNQRWNENFACKKRNSSWKKTGQKK